MESKPEYQAGADVAVEQWTTICLAIYNNTLTAFVGNNTTPVLNKVPLLVAGKPETIGLFFETGTGAYFANLRVQPSISLNLF